jgi:hypothetical protein
VSDFKLPNTLKYNISNFNVMLINRTQYIYATDKAEQFRQSGYILILGDANYFDQHTQAWLIYSWNKSTYSI